MSAVGRILRADELQPVPWRNGQGITREIAAMPPGAGMDDFLWRVSLADVVGAAPFSRFPGVDRTIVLIDGAGFRMTLDGAQVHELTTPCAPFAFPGEAEVAVGLAGGPTRDFNLMLRRGRATGEVEVWRDEAARRAPSDLLLLHLVHGHARTPDGDLGPGDSWLPGADAPGTIQIDGEALAVRVHLAG
ncbi:HutD/Ves family protein [Dyella lutea]|uniref:HutD family protein n=1 Tax=Dyella lutea TaxID=2950441 RepID=A0ABT1F6X2_9GAMM|nr:HutD family protein [Dyella lutea]MCP1373129.1 HutD family protein [Dyella lutea]